MDDEATKLDGNDAEIFHHLVAKLLCLAKRARPDMQTAVAFSCTRAQAPDVDDRKKLNRCLACSKETQKLTLTLEASNMSRIHWWIDASFAVHRDCKSHAGATMTLGKGCPISMSSKQKINTRSSTEAELVGVNDALTLVLWMRLFLESQGFTITDNVIMQDNQSSVLLERNGKRSSGKRTRHIDMRYYFITDNVKNKRASIKHCPTEEMVADFFTKPLQGKSFRQFRKIIMNLEDDIVVTSSEEPQECVGAEKKTDGKCPTPTQQRSWAEVAAASLKKAGNRLAAV